MNTVEFFYKGEKIKTFKSFKSYHLLRFQILNYLNSIENRYPKRFGAPYKFRVVVTTPKEIYQMYYIDSRFYYLQSIRGNKNFQPKPVIE